MALASFFGPLQQIQNNAPAVAAGPAISNPLKLWVDHTVPGDWCWAAVAAGVLAYYDPANAQQPCQIATTCLGPDCCNPPMTDNDPRNTEFGLQGALVAVGHMRDDPVDQNAQPLEFSTVTDEIGRGHPVCCLIKWPEGSVSNGHFIALVGFDPVHQTVDVRDNKYGDQTLPFTRIVRGYLTDGTGVLDTTYFTQ